MCQGNKIYCGIRKGSHGSGTLALPGGHLELYESWEACAIREVQEEMDVDLQDVRFAHVCNNPMPDEEKHYVTIFMMGRKEQGSKGPTNLEPDKCDGWALYGWDDLQALVGTDKLFSPLECLMREAPPAILSFLNGSCKGV